MADPISIISLAIELTPKVVRYILEVREGSNERQRLTAEISSISGILSILQQLPLDPQSNGDWHAALATLGGAEGPLVNYADLLRSIERSLEPKNGFRQGLRNLHWPYRREEVLGYLRQIERYKSLFLLALELDQAQLSRQVHDDLNILKTGVEDLTKKTEELLRLRQGEHYEKILQWISNFDFDKKHKAASSLRWPGTGTWIFQNDLFKQWQFGELKTLLCYGIPGAGKTILASTIIDHLLTQQQSATGVAYLYCDYKDKKSQSFRDLFSSLLKQLIRFSPQKFQNLWDDLHSSRSLDRSLSLDEIHLLSREVVALFDKAYIVIDALDESEEADGTRDKLMSHLVELQAHNAGLRILITSRPKQVASAHFPNAALLELSANQLDIHTYISERLKTETTLQRHFEATPELEPKILKTVNSKCQGMFLLARLHLDSICQALTLEDLEDSLQKLPDGRHSLTDTYQDALDRIHAKDPRVVEKIDRILTWLCFSARPLKVDELRWAVAIDVSKDEEDFNEKRLLLEEDIVRLCVGLVTINVENREVRLVHYTTQEFFLDQRDKLFPNARMVLFRSCLKFLSYSRFTHSRCQDEETLRTLKSQNPFLEYAAKYLGEHARPIEEQVKLEIIQLWKSDTRLDLIYQARLNVAGSPTQNPLCGALSTAIAFGLKHVAAELIANGANIHAVGMGKQRPVHLAGYEGQTEIMQMLITSKADLDTRDGKQNTALHAVACGPTRVGALEMVLQEAPRIINFTNHMGKTALADAAERNKISEVKTLVAYGAAIDTRDGIGRTPLGWAVAKGHSHIVKLLLDAGADPSENKEHGEPLVWHATKLSSADCLSLLLAHTNFDYAARRRKYDISGLHCSVCAGGLRTTRLMLDRDKLHNHHLLDARNIYGKTPLHDVCERGHTALLRMLLDDGADPTLRDGGDRTMLHWAAREGRLGVIEELLRIDSVRALLDVKLKGAGDTANWPHGTALYLAVVSGHRSVALELLKAGADWSSIREDKTNKTAEAMIKEKGWDIGLPK
ncbi:hypothetical protein MMC10_008419 [Thelotrema lepadinum]|nr:hypothetical protein [Thelotrema lepadinum]